MSYYRRGNMMAAQAEFRRAALDSPYNADFRHNLAVAMKRAGDVSGAEQSYKQALELNPTHQPSYHGLAVLMNEQGRRAEADQLLQAYVDTQPYSAGAHIEMAWQKQQNGDYAAAERELQQAIDIKPNHPVALAQLGQLYEQTGQPDRAAAMYRQSLKGNWYQPRVKTRLASVQQSMPHQSQYAFAPGGPAYAMRPNYGPAPTQGRAVAWDYPLPTYNNSSTTVAEDSAPMFSADQAPMFTADQTTTRTATAAGVPTLADEPVPQAVPGAPVIPTEVAPPAPAAGATEWSPSASPPVESPEDPVFDADPAHPNG
jgi:tetratricopeptide (TPR) repeat protein